MRARALFPGSALLALVAVAASLSLAGCGDEGAQANHGSPVEVGTVELSAQPVNIRSTLPGRVSAQRVAEVRPQVTGIIQRRLFTEGVEVKEGQQLYQIDDALYQSAYKKADAAMASAKLLADRYARLLADKAVSRQQYDDALSTYRQAAADVETARVNLAYTRVKSPIAGRIGRSSVTEGALVTNGQAQYLAIVTQLDPIYVDVTQSSVELLRLKRELASGELTPGKEGEASLELVLEDGTTYAHRGTLKFGEVNVDEGTGSVTLRAAFPNPERLLLPGMFVHVRVDEGVRPKAILVPQQAVSRDPAGRAVVWVVKDQKATQREIVANRTIGNTWLVEAGLAPGESVVTEGAQKLRMLPPNVPVVARPASNVRVDLGDATTAAPSSRAN